jgi:tetratricopeptide (TPR) repeat protein
MRIIYYIVISFSILIGSGCTGSKSYSKKARKLQEAGLNDEAASFYLQALQRNPKNVDAKIGLKQTGQIQIERTLTAFYKAYSVTNYKEAVYKYQEALNYKKRYGYFVSVEIPPYYDAYYDEMLVVYLAERYETAGDLLYEEKFKEANIIYKEILNLDSEYEDVKELSLHSTIEPLYRQGIEAFNNEKYRRCYGIMSNVLSQKTMYKEAIDYKEKALEEGSITIAVLPFHSDIAQRNRYADMVHEDVVSGLLQVNDPFVKVVDRTNDATLIDEQKTNVAQSESMNSSINTGELLGANILIKGKLVGYYPSGGKIESFRRQGFESYQIKRVNPDTKKTYYDTKYKRVYYTEFEGASSVKMDFQYQMVSTETGEVVKFEMVRKEKSDYVNFVHYNGNYKNLYPGKFSSKGMSFVKGDEVYSSFFQQRKLRSKIKSKKTTLKPHSQMAADVLKVISKNIVDGISSYNPDEE